MRLDDPVFAGIIKALGAIPENSEPLRRRQSQRYSVDREIAIKPYGMAGAGSRPVTLVNVSAGGVCIVDRVAISTGDRFIASLPLVGGGSISVLCIARQSRLTPTRAYRVGAEFLDEREVQQTRVRGGDDILAAPRRPAPAAEPVASHQQPATLWIGADAIEAEVSRFMEGMFEIISPRAVMPGDEIILEIQFQGRQQMWKCTATEMRDLSRGRWSIVLRNEGAAEDGVPKQRHGWFRRLWKRP